ncbi:MAG: hypothetical protein A3G33_08300 [Omnitrophica bacterium RIFCSPLOWO2_12_FULL_44_17]|uniref:Uncharacterized protein n=1 Tax=Candidatus Danuiimicrobium aquiferis TaxID=1801832 RepID=A0A1G1KWC6_9BACT|nr:MAG: hypothetical protein A3B72_03515 [Omnitrophica bacterium RIFCSPHIGHO2_02_FULL_45_28]OGW90525.1 MAG: hypothetical protein A3E74_03040 [Omnitrophica bacterium RIFCSPHIGHO2_12_FULL_44_12]OGW97165.1 MAG: hypothetical protein A3G33_08300 [Omnitrophica bacterium RIFCSPLOWO2_12_FULL_44_17]OGX02225.1 MAG: hypothetical protein A3J12_08085 [Omnitrophica bacterium RIFCSPLOWO2_02_FULL_44_11]
MFFLISFSLCFAISILLFAVRRTGQRHKKTGNPEVVRCETKFQKKKRGFKNRKICRYTIPLVGEFPIWIFLKIEIIEKAERGRYCAV